MQFYEIYSKWPNKSAPPDLMALFPRDLTLNFTYSAVLFMAPNSTEKSVINAELLTEQGICSIHAISSPSQGGSVGDTSISIQMLLLFQSWSQSIYVHSEAQENWLISEDMG